MLQLSAIDLWSVGRPVQDCLQGAFLLVSSDGTLGQDLLDFGPVCKHLGGHELGSAVVLLYLPDCHGFLTGLGKATWLPARMIAVRGFRICARGCCLI